MSSLVLGYMTVSWTVSPPAVGVRATCGVEGQPEGGGREVTVHIEMHKLIVLTHHVQDYMFIPAHQGED